MFTEQCVKWVGNQKERNKMAKPYVVTAKEGIGAQLKRPEAGNPKIIPGTPTTWQHKMRPSPKLSRGEYLRWLRKKMKMARKGGKWTPEEEASS